MAGTQYWGTGRIGTHQSATYTATAGTISNAISTGVYKVRVVTTSNAFIKIDTNPTATTADVYLPANSPEYFTCTPGQKVSAVEVTGGGPDTLHVTEIV